MAKYISIASGSKGNAGLLVTKNANILIDVGISFKRLTEALKECDIKTIDYVLISHEHSDHVSGLSMLAKKTDTKIFISQSSFENYSESYKISRDRLTYFVPNDTLNLGDVMVETMKTPHDSIESVGFKIFADNIIYSHVTDIGHMPKNILDNISNSNMVTLEANYDQTMLDFGSYPYSLKCRIRSNTGHLSNEESLKCVAHLLQSGVSDIILAHLSESNNHPTLLSEHFENLIFTYSLNQNQKIHIAPAKFENTTINIKEGKLCLQ